MTITEINESLFAEPHEGSWYVQCISSDFNMSEGITAKFDEVFDIRNRLINKNKSLNRSTPPAIGDCVYADNAPVFNLVTKSSFGDRSSYLRMELCLQYLKLAVKKKRVKNLVMPRIGCSLDGLDWIKVKPLIMKVFNDTNISITVYHI